MNNTQKAHTFNTEVLNVPMTEKYTENSDVSNDCFDKTKSKFPVLTLNIIYYKLLYKLVYLKVIYVYD